MAPTMSKMVIERASYPICVVPRAFRFLDLPAEMRNMIYEYCIDLSSVNGWLDKYHEKLKNSKRVKKVRIPPIYLDTPSVLLINRQIYNEAVGYVQTQSITFQHGTFIGTSLPTLIAPSVLQRIRSITINSDPASLFHEHYGAQVWCGYLNLFNHLGEVLSYGHKLQELSINFQESAHTRICWHNDWSCGYRDALINAIADLRSIRGVKKVTITGFPEEVCKDLTEKISRPRITFSDLPPKVCDTIFAYAAMP